MGWLEEQYKGTQTVGDDGKVDGRGLGAFLWQQFVDEDELNRSTQRTINTRTALAGGEDIGDLDGIDDTSSVYDVQGAVKRKGRQRESEAEETRHTRGIEAAMAPVTAQLQASQQQLTAQLQESREQRKADLALARQKLQQSNNLQLLQLAETKDARIQQLQYQKMRDRKEDMQYNERMEQLDRKDRRTAIQNMVAGLASLGAAFAM